MTEKVWSDKALDYNNNMKEGCYVVSYEDAVFYQLLFHLRYSMYSDTNI